MAEATPAKNPTAVIETTEGTINVEFWNDVAPGHVKNFTDLAKKGFYNGLIFHRVIPGFMIQGGCPDGTGTGGPGYQIKAEFNRRPDRKHTRGVLSMARSSNPDSAGSQFFVMHQDSTHLDGQYSAFGKVTSGIEVVDKIVSVPTGANDRPKNPPKIIKITVNE
jgi:peptidyl-prolyl cis-trans isomerase B (cyclophilin B)